MKFFENLHHFPGKIFETIFTISIWDFKGHFKAHWDMQDFSRFSKLLRFLCIDVSCRIIGLS